MAFSSPHCSLGFELSLCSSISSPSAFDLSTYQPRTPRCHTSVYYGNYLAPAPQPLKCSLPGTRQAYEVHTARYRYSPLVKTTRILRFDT